VSTCLLTKREVEVAQLIADMGTNARCLGKAMSLSRWTIKIHINNIRNHMGTDSITNAVAMAWSRGWIK
jgi:DNA-binding NarL/FixJ family response regulator